MYKWIIELLLGIYFRNTPKYVMCDDHDLKNKTKKNPKHQPLFP